MRVVVYGVGGFDPTKPSGNIIDEHEADDPPEFPTIEARLAAVEARFDRATAVPVAGDAARLRDAMKDVG